MKDGTPEKFWDRVIIRGVNDCWPWSLDTNHYGYGKLGWKGRTRAAHQVAYELTYGIEFPGGRIVSPDTVFVCHSCDNPPCCNPGHLFLGTPLVNQQDSVNKGRKSVGEKHGASTRPENRPRGDTHGLRLHPEAAARGDRNGSRLHPEKMPRGSSHWTYIRPEDTTRGSDHGQARLSESDIVSIRDRRSTGEKLKSIAADYGVCKAHISAIATRKFWKHVL